jgi:hypothetical protein
MTGPSDQIIEVTADEHGPRDNAAPVAGGQLNELPWEKMFDAMDPRDRARASKKMYGAHPDVRRANRDRVRFWLALILIIAAIVDAAVALVLALGKTITWGDMRDWLTLAVAPLTAGIAVAYAFWYPTKEIE